MNFKISFLLILVLFSCKKEDIENDVLVIGHGGMGLDFSGSIYHDNSEEAFNLALDINECDGVEIDVRLSADGDLWAYHDEVLDDETNNEGCVENKVFSDLDGTDYNGFGSEKLKRLKDMNLVAADKRLFLDIKHYNACNQTVHDVNDFLNAMSVLPAIYLNPSRVRIVLANPAWIPDFIAAGYHVLYSSDDQSDIASVFDQYADLRGVVIKNQSISETEVSNIIAQSKSVYIFEVRSPKKLKEARKKNPTGIMSDDVQSAILECK